MTDLGTNARSFGLFSIITFSVISALWSLSSLVTKWKNDESLALDIERRNKTFDSRLISSIQFAKRRVTFPDYAPMSMIQSMISETKEVSRKFNYLEIVNPKAMIRASLTLFLVIIISGAWAINEKDSFMVLLKRAIGKQIEIPRDTVIVNLPEIKRVGIGDNVTLSYKVKSKKTTELNAKLKVNFDSGRKNLINLERSESDETIYSTIIEDVPESFTFNAQIDDAKTASLKIIAIERPSIKKISATQNYPKFTKQDSTRHVPGDFTFFPGSEVTINIESSKELTAGNLKFLGIENQLPLSISNEDNKKGEALIKIPSKNLSGFSVSLTDTEEMNSKNAAIYKISLLTDLPPEIRITYPKRSEELVTRKARFLIEYEASDRFGVNSINLKYRRNESEVITIPVLVDESGKSQIKDNYEWDLGSLNPSLSEGDQISYWLEAADQNTAGSNISTTEILTLKVVTSDEKRADLLGRTSDALGSVDEATNDQETLNKDLESIIRKNTPIKKN
tara:strand:+ start:30 stop:1553 length:1524 start_codon:yes stop_codon:yes gene_type:complete